MKKEYDNSIAIEEVIDDFNLLIKEDIVGFYNRCEVIEIFGYKGGKPFNIFTLVVFEKGNEVNETEEFLTKNLMKFDRFKDIKWGITRKVISIDSCKEFFKDLISNNTYKFKESISATGKLTFTKKQYIPPDFSIQETQLNKILKNNFGNGSYIIEAFDVDKINVDFLLYNAVILNKLSESISEIIPIKIGTLSDRLGNVIFQFPIRIFETKLSVIKPDKGFTLTLVYNKATSKIPNLKVVAYNKFDGLVMDFKIQEIREQADILLSTANSVEVQIINPQNDLILSTDIFNTIKNFKIDMRIISHQNRVFSLNSSIVEVTLSSSNDISSRNNSKEMGEWILDRKYEQELKTLESSKSFVQYFKDQSEKALSDVRFLIKKYGKRGVYLWDPYLNARDIKNTLYYTPYSYVPLKAITNLMDTNCSKKEEVIQSIREEFNTDHKEYLFMDLELRCKSENNGWDFHDRFLIFPLEKPKVWSLGISLNQLGKSHHILQEVKNAQHILNAFNALWDELNDKECMIWKSR